MTKREAGEKAMHSKSSTNLMRPAPLTTAWGIRQLEDSSIASTMRNFRRKLQAGWPDDDLVPMRPQQALVYNARTLPGNHCCWINAEEPMRRLMRSVPLYGCLDCARTHICRARGLPQSIERRKELRRDEASDLCPLLPSASGGTYVCAITGREVQDAQHFAPSASYDEWVEQRGATFDRDDDGDDGGGGGGGDDLVTLGEGLQAVRHDSESSYKQSQFTSDAGARQRALDTQRAGAKVGRGVRHLQLHERARSAAQGFTEQNIDAYRVQHQAPLDFRAILLHDSDPAHVPAEEQAAYDEDEQAVDLLLQEERLAPESGSGTVVDEGDENKDMALVGDAEDKDASSKDDDDDDEAEEEEEDANSEQFIWTGGDASVGAGGGTDDDNAEETRGTKRKRHGQRIQIAIAGDTDEAMQGTQSIQRSRPALRDYDFWRRYYFIGDQTLARLFATQVPPDQKDEPGAWFDRARRIFSTSLPHARPPPIKATAGQQKTAPPPRTLLHWHRNQYRQYYYHQFTLNDGTVALNAHFPSVPARWMESLWALLRLLWPDDATRCDDLTDFLARWIRLGCFQLANENRSRKKRSTYEDRVLKQFPPASVLAAFILYLGRLPIVLIDGLGHRRVLRGYDAPLVALFESQLLQRRIFLHSTPISVAVDYDILAGEEEKRMQAIRRYQAMRQRGRTASGVFIHSAMIQALHMPPSARLGVLELMDTTKSSSSSGSGNTKPTPPLPQILTPIIKSEEEEPVKIRITPGQVAANPFACTLAQVHGMRDHMCRLIMAEPSLLAPARKKVKAKHRKGKGRAAGGGSGGKIGGRVQFTATYFIQWFRDEALQCWPLRSISFIQPSPPLQEAEPASSSLLFPLHAKEGGGGGDDMALDYPVGGGGGDDDVPYGVVAGSGGGDDSWDGRRRSPSTFHF